MSGRLRFRRRWLHGFRPADQAKDPVGESQPERGEKDSEK